MTGQSRHEMEKIIGLKILEHDKNLTDDLIIIPSVQLDILCHEAALGIEAAEKEARS